MSELLSFISTPWVYWTLLVTYGITVISIVGVVLSENRNPVKSLAWITVLLMFPVGGVVLYIFFGRNLKNLHMISRRNRKWLRQRENIDSAIKLPSQLSDEVRHLATLGRSLAGAPFFGGNDTQLFHYGQEKFNTLFADIEKAERYVNLQYYIIEDDNIGTRLADLLIRKAEQGVSVRVIYDDIGSMHVKRKFFKRMAELGVESHPFFRVVFPPFATRINWRNHRKLCVIDGKIGYIGGMNVADRYIDGGKKFAKWRDTHLRIEGPAVAALQESFAIDWKFMGQPQLDQDVDLTPLPGDDLAGMQLLTSGPTSQWGNISFMMLKAFGEAKKRIYIQTPYFLPPDSMLRALQAAALARVDVRVMMPKRSDSLILTYASYSYIQECLRAGIKIFLYEGGMLHSKVMMVDDEISAIGSANIDFRSFEHNFEATMFVTSQKVNGELAKQFATDELECQRVKLADWKQRPRRQRMLESVIRLLSPVL